MQTQATLHALFMALIWPVQTQADSCEPKCQAPALRIEQIDVRAIEKQNRSNARSPQSPAHSTELLVSLVRWLSENFDLPRVSELPTLKFIPQQKLQAMRYGALMWNRNPPTKQNELAATNGQTTSVVALYDGARRMIYLPEGWTGKSPTEVSVLVHELVHHMQHLGGLRFECAELREKLGYAAQERWLAKFGRTLEDEFGVDSLTLLARTNCFH